MSSEPPRPTLAKAGRAAIDLTKIGVAAIPIVGGTVVEIIEVLDERRLRRVERFRDELLAQIGNRLVELETRMGEEEFANLMDDAVERAARTRSEAHIDLIARVVAEALTGNFTFEQFEYHHMLLRLVAELLPAHLQLLVEVGTIRVNVGGPPMDPAPTVGHGKTKRRLALQLPDLATFIDPLLAELLAFGVVNSVPDEIVKAINASERGRQPIRPEEKFALTDYGKWVIEQLESLAAKSPN